MMRFYQLIWVVFFVFVLGKSGLAQSQSAADNALDPIRVKMISAEKENKALKAENERLKTLLSDLQWEVANSEKEAEELRKKYPHKAKSERELSAIFSKASSDFAELTEDELFIQEAQNLFLSGQVIVQTDEQKLNELYLYDLQFQKQELQIDLQEKKVAYQTIKEEQSQKLNALQAAIQDNIEKQRELRDKITQLEKEALAYPQVIDLLKMENKGLEHRIQQLRKKY